MFKKSILIICITLITHCSLDTKSGLWTKSQNIEKSKENLEEIFKSDEVLEKEFNPSLKIKINSKYNTSPFVDNLNNNSGYINFESDFKKVKKFKFKKIKSFDYINPDLLIGKDNAIIFFDEKGSILKFNDNTKLIWKKNHYTKKEIKLNPVIYLATDNKTLIAADSIANYYAIDYLSGDLLWKKFNTSPFSSEIKIYADKFFLIDFENVIKCISIKDGKEIWRFSTEKSFIKSQRKLSFIIHNDLVIFIDTFGDINALDINSGNLVWQTQTVNEDTFESSFLLKSSRLVSDEETIYVSNNQNKFFAINLKNGLIKWEQSINSHLEPTVIENLVFTISQEGYLFVIDKQTGNILRSSNILNFKKNKNIFPTGFIVGKNYFFISLNNGKLLKVSIADGKIHDIIKIDSGKITRPYVVNKNMYILKDNSIVMIN